MNYTIHTGDNVETLKTLADNSVDSIVTDPPYGIAFLGKDWDNNTGAIETWEECFRVLKPGGHILAFSAARTYHHLATNIEAVGFEIRDQLMWLYGSGFPKAHDMGKIIDKRAGPEAKQWSGWKTALKPAHEPIVMARKPFKGSCVDNVLEHGVGALNIDESRIPATDKAKFPVGNYTTDTTVGSIRAETRIADEHTDERFPSNVLGEVEDYQKYFYCPKVSRKERHVGFEQVKDDRLKIPGQDPRQRQIGRLDHIPKANSAGNNHPTVKPVELMKYLIKLVTPAGGKVLDPFNGSGSTGMAAVELGYEYIGCELDPEYVEIAKQRIEGWYKQTQPKNNFDNMFKVTNATK